MDQLQEYQKEETIDIKALLFRLKRHWYYFVCFVIIALAIAYMFNRYAEKVYQVTATVLVKDDKGTGASLMTGMDMFAPQKKIQNEIGILKSYSLSRKAVIAMNMQVTYMVEGRFRFSELYKASPFEVQYDSAFPQLVNVPVILKIISDNNYEIEFGEIKLARLYNFRQSKIVDQISIPGKIKKNLAFGETYQNKYFSFKINKTNDFPYANRKGRYKFYLNTIDQLASQMWGVEVEPINKEASLLTISLIGKE